ncbi:MAG: hypothetical protein WKF35_05635 [Ferruginibacter sp.]
MNTQSFAPDESLRLIRSMIDKTRQDISDNSIYFLIWGWGALIGCIGQFVLKVVLNYNNHYNIWFVTIICLILSVYVGIKDRKREKVQTYVGESMGHLWSGLGITFFVISMIFMRIGWQYCFPFFILLYGLGTFVSGRILKYTPLVIGGCISFLLAMISTWVTYDYQMLLAALALLASYIIPGHMLRASYNNAKNKGVAN